MTFHWYIAIIKRKVSRITWLKCRHGKHFNWFVWMVSLSQTVYFYNFLCCLSSESKVHKYETFTPGGRDTNPNQKRSTEPSTNNRLNYLKRYASFFNNIVNNANSSEFKEWVHSNYTIFIKLHLWNTDKDTFTLIRLIVEYMCPICNKQLTSEYSFQL